MRIHVNGESRELAESRTLLELLNERGLRPERVAVEVNGELVSRSRYGETRLAPEDRIEIVTFVGGG